MTMYGGGFGRPGRAAVTMVLALGLLMAGPRTGDAQQRTRPGPERLQEQIRERFGALVRRDLGLDRDAQEALARVVQRFQEERRELGARRLALRREIGGGLELRDVVRGQSPPLLSDEEARVLIDAIVDLQEEEARLFREEQEALLEVLTPAQLVRFHALREAFAERVRAVRGRGPGPGGAGGPPPGGAGPPGPPFFR